MKSRGALTWPSLRPTRPVIPVRGGKAKVARARSRVDVVAAGLLVLVTDHRSRRADPLAPHNPLAPVGVP